MALQKVDGRTLANSVDQKTKQFLEDKKQSPVLVDIIIGNDPATNIFVDVKEKAALKLGLTFEKKAYPEGFDYRLIHTFIQEKNQDLNVNGILIQLPLPPAFNQTSFLKAIHPFKDVDALHPKNLGMLVSGEPIFISPVTLGVLEIIRSQNLFDETEIEYLHQPLTIPNLQGVTISIIGSGILVGKPLANMFMNLGATVSIFNEHSTSTSNILKQSKIIITGTNAKDVLSPEDVSDGSLVIDVGHDVNAERFATKDITLSTHPGGIGPLTVAYLLYNTALATKTATSR